MELQIKAFVRTLIQHEYKRLGWDEKDGESSSDRKLRGIILGLGAYAEDPAIVAEALKRFTAYKRDSSSISPELRGIPFSVAVKKKADDAFNYLLALHDKTTSSDLQSDISASLSGTKDKAEAKRLLARLKDAKLVKAQDADHWLAFMLRNRHIRDVAWDWMVKQWPWIHETYSQGMSYDYFPRYASAICNTREWAKKYKDLFEPKLDEVALKRNIQIGFNEIETRVKWLSRDLAAVQAFFK